MKININICPELTETTIDISCSRIDEHLEKLISLLKTLDFKLTGKKDNQTFLLDYDEILYAEVVDRHTYLYSANEIYESGLKLYELEELLEPHGFIRSSKSTIINIKSIRSLKSDTDGKLLTQMKNGEKLFISRQYAVLLKRKLGVIK